MKHTNFDREWEFQQGEPSSFPMMRPETRTVTLPHDMMIEGDVSRDVPGGAETGFYKGCKGSYTKRIEFSEEELRDNIYMLGFDGVAGAMKLIVNGHTVRRHHYAYTPFTADITRYLTAGKNRVTVTVNSTDEPNSRWYMGTGLYRSVELLTSLRVHIAPNGIFVRTEKVTENDGENTARQIIDVTVANDSDIDAEVGINIEYRYKGNLLTAGAAEKNSTSGEKSEWQQVITDESLAISAHGSETAALTFDIVDAALWDIDEPNLYEIRVTICEKSGGTEITDTETASFGIRTITMDAQNGMRLNGKPILLKGGCIHHDNGILGAAAHRDSEYRKVRLHKDNGFNALRYAHNPVSSYMLNACDELGMLVIDEAYDVWRIEKNDFDFAQHFDAEGETELVNMLLRDRNHPCVFMWSIGNEIPEQGGLSDGYETSRRLVELTRSIDPTRAVGGALCSFFRGLTDEDNDKYWASIMENAEELKKNGMVNLDCPFGQQIWDPYTAPFAEGWDAVGYNYLEYHYEPSHEMHPERVMICTESKPRELFDYWEEVKRLPYLIGDFEWTSMDYLGEAGIGLSHYVEPEQEELTRNMMHVAQYPVRTAGSGDFDICGFEKPEMAYRRIVWGSDETALMTHNPANYGKVEILGRYAWGDAAHHYTYDAEAGSRMTAEIYSAADTVELFVNGESQGRREAGHKNEYRALYEITYEPGELRAVSYGADGSIISEDVLTTAGKPSKMTARASAIAPDGREIAIPSDGIVAADCLSEGDLIYMTIELTDDEDRRVPYIEERITAAVSGAGELLALGTGRIVTDENYTKGEITTYEGRALAVIRATAAEGDITLSIHSESCVDVRVSIR